MCIRDRHNKYAYLDNLENSGEVLKSTLQKVDQLKLKMELQKLSFDSLYNIALSKEKKLASIPSIKPVKEDDLKKGVKFLSGFGMRIHPIHCLLYTSDAADERSSVDLGGRRIINKKKKTKKKKKQKTKK